MIHLVGSRVEIGQNNEIILIIKSEKKMTFSLNLDVDLNCFQELQDIFSWIISPKRDAKTRHQIFIGCMVREGGENDCIWHYLKESALYALESAQLNYDSLLDKESRESLKVMIDIRKAIFDAASQISKDAQDISSRAAADIAAIVGLLIARVALVGKVDFLFGKFLLIVAFIYVVYRVYSVLYISKRFLKRQIRHVNHGVDVSIVI
ncbi:hypothetical protein [Deefgea sp. CFH1-16]|uniref:hypothetical protein n=1 Tax=Deefgea sp. CFH1-16 TaxID=2675457 RepID=UPI0015F4E74B|nr:hypothetical protein [Deefgea sp. CFH1-16]MBM5575246.1 hypothetical protein [Deefgea sp. CFH1-16]